MRESWPFSDERSSGPQSLMANGLLKTIVNYLSHYMQSFLQQFVLIRSCNFELKYPLRRILCVAPLVLIQLTKPSQERYHLNREWSESLSARYTSQARKIENCRQMSGSFTRATHRRTRDNFTLASYSVSSLNDEDRQPCTGTCI